MKLTDNNRYLHAGDSGFFVNFDHHPDEDAVLLARQLGQIIIGEARPAGVVDVTPGLKNLLIHYDPCITSFDTLTGHVTQCLKSLDLGVSSQVRHWRIPVLYGGDAGPDIEDVAAAAGLHPDDVISRHIGKTITVAIMGFLPGLAYMKGVDPALYLPRKSSPRAHVPARSVGIAMDQTVIYPLPSPGGWNLIGRTPIRPFDHGRASPVLFAPGDAISFTSISQAEYDEIDQAASHGEDVIAPEEGG